MVKRGHYLISSYQGPNQPAIEAVPHSQSPTLEGPLLLASDIDMVIKLSPHAKESVFNSPDLLVLGREKPVAPLVGPKHGGRESQDKNKHSQKRYGAFHFFPPPFAFIKRYHIFCVLAVSLVAGCSTVSGIGKPAHRSVSAEFRQKVGLYVHDRSERVSYYGSAATDTSDLMAFHLQTTLPNLAQEALQELFDQVEMSESAKEARPKITFKTPDLAGYFEISILNIRYDYPDANLSSYRAEVQLLIEFKTLQHREVWSEAVEGHGLGFSKKDLRLTDFGQGSAAALEEAFQEAVDEMEESIVKSQPLRDYLRRSLVLKGP